MSITSRVFDFDNDDAPGPVEVTSPEGSIAFVCDALKKFQCNIAELVPHITGRLVTTSSSFSGIGTAEISDDMVSAQIKQFLNSRLVHGAGDPISFKPLWLCEKNTKCVCIA